MVNTAAGKHRRRFTSVDHPVQMLPVMLFIKVLRIVIPHTVKLLCAFLWIFPFHKVRADGNRRMSFGIKLAYSVTKGSGDLDASFRYQSILNFIPDTPHQKTCPVAVPSDPGFHILFKPVVKKSGIIIGGLCFLPHVKSFRQHQKAHFIRQLHKLRRRHIMGCPDGVYAHLPKL